MKYTSKLQEPNEISKLHKFSANAKFIGSDGSGKGKFLEIETNKLFNNKLLTT